MSQEQTAVSLTGKALAFIAANKRSPVVSGHVKNPRADGCDGIIYTLNSGKRFDLDTADIAGMPMPHWKGQPKCPKNRHPR